MKSCKTAANRRLIDLGVDQNRATLYEVAKETGSNSCSQNSPMVQLDHINTAQSLHIYHVYIVGEVTGSTWLAQLVGYWSGTPLEVFKNNCG